MSVRLRNTLVERMVRAAQNRSGNGPAVPTSDEHDRPARGINSPIHDAAHGPERTELPDSGSGVSFTTPWIDRKQGMTRIDGGTWDVATSDLVATRPGHHG